MNSCTSEYMGFSLGKRPEPARRSLRPIRARPDPHLFYRCATTMESSLSGAGAPRFETSPAPATPPANSKAVMPGLVPGIHAFAERQDVDGRDKPGHDSREHEPGS
jgi:hypothetical protein